MASSAENITQVSSMPIPPMHYVKLYTDEAVKRGTAPKPPPPIQETYSMFGVTINNDDAIIQSLESQGIKRLYSAKDIDRKKELRKLNHSILVNFLDLIDILIKCPESPKRDEKIEDTNLLFIHMHHLINEFRPHQARETLRVMLMVQRRKRTQFTGKFKEHLEKVEGIIQEAIDNLPEIEVENGMDTSDIKNFKDKDAKTNEEGAKENCNSLDRIMCQIVDELSLDMELVLTSVSRLLHGVMKDLVSDGEDDIRIILPELDQGEMELLLQFLYTGSADLTADHEHVIQLLQALEVPLAFDSDMLKLSKKDELEQAKLKMLLTPTCPMETSVDESEIFHMEKVHPIEPLQSIPNSDNIDDCVTLFSFTCSICDLYFDSEQSLSNHMKSDHQYRPELVRTESTVMKYKCDFCDKEFQLKSLLETHIQSEHETFICDLCNKVLGSSDALTQHKSTHRAAKNFKCSKCDELFRWRAEYRRHAETVHGQKITDMTTCNICNKQIVSKRLNEHIKSVHGNERPFHCKQCTKRFAKPSELRNHLRTHTGERPFECDICNASFAYSHILTRHKKYHDGTKKFTCNVCSKSFLQKNDLIKHSRIHSGEKPYKCDLCGKDFARMDYLKKHQMLHSTETKFCCAECGELCGSVDGLKKHRKHSHNKEKPNIEFNSFEDLALQLPNIASIGSTDNMLESISELQAVSLDGGKTIMILNESEHSVYTEVHLQDDMDNSDTVAAEHILNSDPAVNGGSVIFQTEQSNLSSFVEPTEVLYAVEY